MKIMKLKCALDLNNEHTFSVEADDNKVLFILWEGALKVSATFLSTRSVKKLILWLQHWVKEREKK